MKTFLEYLPLIAFFVVFKTVDIYWATASLIATSALQLAYGYYTTKTFEKRHVVFFFVALIMGSLTIFFRDDTFIKWKVTIVNAAFAIGLLVSTFVFSKNPIKAMLGKEIVLPEQLWTKLVIAWSLFFAVCAGLNLYIAYNYSQDVWVDFKVFGLMGLTFAFAIITMIAVYPHLPKENKVTDQTDTQETKK